MSATTHSGRLIDGRYSLTGELREGGMSTVGKAYDIREQRFCAIKRMKGVQDDLRLKESFNREHAALSTSALIQTL